MLLLLLLMVELKKKKKRMLAYPTNHSYAFQVWKTIRLSKNIIIIYMIIPNLYLIQQYSYC